MEISFIGRLAPVTEGVVTVRVAFSHELPRYNVKAFCILDAVHSTTATGNKVLGVLRGALGRSFFASHSTKWVPGYDSESEKLSAAVLWKAIIDLNVPDSTCYLMEEDDTANKKQFSEYVMKVTPDMDKKVHAALGENSDLEQSLKEEREWSPEVSCSEEKSRSPEDKLPQSSGAGCWGLNYNHNFMKIFQIRRINMLTSN